MGRVYKLCALLQPLTHFTAAACITVYTTLFHTPPTAGAVHVRFAVLRRDGMHRKCGCVVVPQVRCGRYVQYEHKLCAIWYVGMQLHQPRKIPHVLGLTDELTLEGQQPQM